MAKTVMITGVLGGIGSGLAKAFKENGYYVTGLDIRQEACKFCDKLIHFDLNRYCTDEGYRIDMNAKFENEIPELHV